MNASQIAVIASLRSAGYAVCIFNPEEMRGAIPGQVEDAMRSSGGDAIDILGDAHDADED